MLTKNHSMTDKIGNRAVETLCVSLLEKLRRRHLTLAVAESCTGGLICDMLTDVPGISEVLLEGLVCYGNSSKVRRLGISPRVISRYGAVSERVAAAMARGVARTARASVGLSATGIAGPAGGSPQKPVGLVYVGVCLGRKTTVRKFRFGGRRKAVKRQAAVGALQMLLRCLKPQHR